MQLVECPYLIRGVGRKQQLIQLVEFPYLTLWKTTHHDLYSVLELYSVLSPIEFWFNQNSLHKAQAAQSSLSNVCYWFIDKCY
jgi:hypothetical protein